MADSIERIADELDLMAESVQAMSPATKERKLRNIATRLRAISPAGGDWIKCADRLPARGQAIQGRNAKGGTWSEYFDPREPLGLMTEWRDDTDAASPQQEPGAASDYAAWMQDPDSGVEPPEQWKEAYRLGRDVGHEECATAQHDPSGQTLAGAGGALDAIYTDFCAKDNGDVPLERYPQGAVDALASAGWAVVPCDLPFAVLGDAAQAGVFETGNPKHGWDYLVARTRIGPNATATSAGTTGDDSEDAAQLAVIDGPEGAEFPALDWPADGRFTVNDEPGEHDPCWLVMPGGEMLAFRHHAINGVDQARAKFIADACNAAIDAARRAREAGNG